MEWLQLSPNGAWSFALIVWFFGAVAGYCFGRAHAAWLHIDKLFDTVADNIENLNKGSK
jgi:hypothetical protein